jgi:hypothetical protein
MSLISGWLVASIGLLIALSYLIFKASTKAPMRFAIWGSLAAATIALLLGAQTMFQFLWGRVVSISVATSPFWPKVPKGFDFRSNATGDYVSGGFDSATVEVSGISMGPRLMFAIAAMLLAVVVVLISLFVRRVAKAIESGSTLSAALAKSASFTGWVTLIAGSLSSILNLVGNNIAQSELFGTQRSFGWDQSQVFENPWVSGNDANLDGVYGFIMPSPHLIIDLWPIAIALALLLITKVIRRANKLEQEVEGLV